MRSSFSADSRILFALDVNGTLHAFDAHTGAERWTRAPNCTLPVAYAGTSGSIVLVSSTDTMGLTALDVASGAVVWSLAVSDPSLGEPQVLVPATGASGILFVASNATLSCLQAADGSVVWSLDLDSMVDELITFDFGPGAGAGAGAPGLLATSNSGTMYAFKM
jgi:outer membrane protein assembly factor BamB